MTYCGKCGAENPDGNGFCYKCGARLEGSPYRSVSDVREIKVERPEPPKAARLEEVPDNGSPYRSFKDVRTRTAAGTNVEVPGEEKDEPVTDYTKVDLPGMRRKAPRSNDHTSVLAVVIVAAVLIVACVSIYYMMPEEDNGEEWEYHSFYDIPRSHPLYGAVVPDGDYSYSGYFLYQGERTDITLEYTVDGEQIRSATLNGQLLSQSEIDDLLQSGGQISFNIGPSMYWNDGSDTYLVYALYLSNGSTTYVAENGFEVYTIIHEQGATMELTLDGWSIGTYYSNDDSEESLTIGPEIIDRYTFGEGC